MPNRPSRRTLVRWNDDHDKELLLWIVYCCNEQGIKIPFARIAQCMGASFTEGACVQHLAKIRTKMEEAGLHVPPTQKRGTVTRTGSSIYRPRPKEITAPVPRTRPDTAPAPTMGDYDDYDDDDEEEEEVEEHFDFGDSPSKARTKQNNSFGYSQQRRRETSSKHDSEDDNQVPALYDSDNEYGAKKPKSSPPETQAGKSPKVQVKLTFGEKALKMPAGSNRDNAGSMFDQVAPSMMQTSQASPGVKYESMDASMADHTARPGPTRPHGTRRKMSALALEEDDDDTEYDPGNKGKGRGKKPRVSRAAKKPKVDEKTKTRRGSAKQKKTQVTPPSYEEDAEHDIEREADRTAMPPPAYPLYNAEFGGGWNTNFMQHPFASADQSFTFDGVDHNDGAYNDFSPTIQYGGIRYLQGPGSGVNSSFNAYQRPSLNNYVGGMPAANPATNTRNPSFASVDSSSTVESQPRTWNQPYRSPGFPNPREATMALHNVVAHPDVNAGTGVNLYQTLPFAARPINGFGFRSIEDPFLHDNALQMSNTEQETLIPELPQLREDEVDFSQFLDNDYL